MPLKKYFFEVKTLKSLSDVNSPHTLLKVEFLAENESEAQEYRNSLYRTQQKKCSICNYYSIPNYRIKKCGFSKSYNRVKIKSYVLN